MTSDSDSGEEIIFNYATIDETLKNVGASTMKQTVAQEPVDLDIILLEPRSRRPGSLRRSKRDRGFRSNSSRSEKSMDLREFDPFAPDDDADKTKNTSDDGTKSTITESSLPPKDKEENGGSRSGAAELIDRGNSNEQGSLKTSRKSKPKKSPTIDAHLLEKMERRYRGNRVPKDDDSLHIDYMDYF